MFVDDHVEPADPTTSDLFFYAGDFNRDRLVNTQDYLTVLQNFGTAQGHVGGDANNDGLVNTQDLMVVLQRFSTSLPAAPAGANALAAGGATAASADLTWTAPDWDYDGFRVWRGADDAFDLELVAELRDANLDADADGDPANDYAFDPDTGIAGWTDDALSDGTTYWYRVRPFTDAGGNAHTTNKARAVTVLPAPDFPEAHDLADAAYITWQSASQNHTRFRVDYLLPGGDPLDEADWHLGGHADAGEWGLEIAVSDAGPGVLSPDALFRVRAERADDAGDPYHTSGWVQTSVLGPTIVRPATPSGISAPATGQFVDGVTFSWADNADDEDRYVVEWQDDDNGWLAIAHLPPDSTSYTDEYPVLGRDNAYRVRAERDDAAVVVPSHPTAPVEIYPEAPPVAWHDTNGGPSQGNTISGYRTSRGHSISIAPQWNDRDYDGAGSGTKPITSFTQPDHGTVAYTFPNQAKLTYTPPPDFTGRATFTYTTALYDQHEAVPAKVTIDVTNSAPVAVHNTVNWDPYAFPDGLPVTDLLESPHPAYATDADGDELTYRIIEEPQHGTLAFNESTGFFSYQPVPDFPGADRFTYVANDGLIDSLPASIEINYARLYQHFHHSYWGISDATFDVRSIIAPGLAYNMNILQEFDQVPLDISVYDRDTLLLDFDWAPDVGLDEMQIEFKVGEQYTTPMTLGVVGVDSVYYGHTPGGGGKVEMSRRVSSFHAQVLENFYGASAHARLIDVVVQPEHGTVTGLEYGSPITNPVTGHPYQGTTGDVLWEPHPPQAGQEPYVGWDRFAYRVVVPPSNSDSGHMSIDEAFPLQWVTLFIKAPHPVDVGPTEGGSPALDAGLRYRRDSRRVAGTAVL